MEGVLQRARHRFSARPQADTLVVAVVGLVGLRLGLSRVSDNSAFTHLATGIRMVSRGVIPAIPRVDPYTFTARGHRWVVQSWLAEAAVGWAHRLGGEHAVAVLGGVTMGGLAWLVATLARTGKPTRTGVAAVAALLVGAPLWAPRPLLVGLVCLALTVLVVERRWSPWWLVPIVWVWVNSHGSFPLGAAWLGLATVGSWVDGRNAARDAENPLLGSFRDQDRRETTQERVSARYGVGFLAGLVAAAINPLGLRLLTFPATVVSKRDVFSQVTEWGSPDFQSAEGTAVLIGLVVAVGVVVSSARRLGWRDVLPMLVFVGLGLSAQRNLSPLGVVLAPVLGRALRVDADPVVMPKDRFRVVAVGLAVAAVAVAFGATRNPLVDASTYPVQAIAWLEDHQRFDTPHRVVTPLTVGNYLELRHGPRGEVFIDDRVDLFPVELTRDYIAMRDGTDRGVRALDRWRIDTVLWPSDEALAQRLVAEGEWAVAVRRSEWVVLVRLKD